jgi:ABC-type transport system involved in cytochrome c biogenesis permease component
MSPWLHQLEITLRLHFRNRMALLYGYLFPLIFLVAFWVLYRHERVPLARHMGELLTVTALGGACFGLPTTMVSERERGVWRRYRLAPVSTQSLVTGTVAARYIALVTAGLLQVALAMAVGMPAPRHPFDLWIAFTFVSFAFLGLGLVMAMMADNVPAVQALGQCIFLPMLIIGGVAVPLASLPDWAQHVSAFFPGRYAVEALQTSVTGDGLGAARFSLLALVLVGASGCVAAGQMFRWDAQQRFAARGGKAWLAVAFAGWAAVGLLAESRGLIGAPRHVPASEQAAAAPAAAVPATRSDTPTNPPPPVSAVPPVTSPPTAAPAEGGKPMTAVPEGGKSLPVTPEIGKPVPPQPNAGKPAEDPPAAPAATPDPAPATEPPAAAPADKPRPPATRGPASWQAVTLADIERDLIFDRLPSDQGVVTPIAAADEDPDPEVGEDLEFVRQALPNWAPGKVADPVQRVRNYLYVAAVPDVFQSPVERHMPHVVYERLQEDIPKDQLIQILYWIALHPSGDDSALDQMWALRLGNGPSDAEQARERMALYGVKLLGRLTGKIVPR